MISGCVTCVEGAADPGWQTAAPIENDVSGSAIYPQVAVDGSGNALAVWQQSDGTRYNIWSNRFTVEAGWGEADLIETNDAGDAIMPQVAVDNLGNAIAVWQQDNGARYCIYSNRYVIGTGWGNATLVESSDSEGAFSPQIAVDNSGNAMVVWRQDDGIYDGIYASRYVAGSSWEGSTYIGTERSWWDMYVNDLKIAIDGLGNAMVVWSESELFADNIWSNVYLVGVGWGVAMPIAEDYSGFPRYPQVVFDSPGSAIAVWQESNGVIQSIRSNRYVIAMGWENATFIEADDIGDNSCPHIASDGSGNAMAVWVQSDAAKCGIRANRYIAESGWQGVTIAGDYSSGSIGYPRVAISDCGNAIAVWSHNDGNGTGICSNRYDAETGWGTGAFIGNGVSLNAGDPQVAIDDSGNAMVAWWQYDGTPSEIWWNQYIEPPSSQPSIISTVAVFALIATGAAIIILSILWLRKRKGN